MLSSVAILQVMPSEKQTLWGKQTWLFMLFVLLYTPCLSAVATLRQESRSWGFTALAVAWPLLLAWLASFLFYQLARALTAA